MGAQLFGSRLSPFVEKVARGLQLKGIEFTVVEPKSPADFKRWNPQTQKMPVLDLGSEQVYDSTFILRRLDELVPEPRLYDRDPQIAARQRFVEDWSDESLYWYNMGFRWTDVNAAATVEQLLGALRAPAFVKPVLRIVIRRQIRGQAIAQGLVRLPLERLVEELGYRFDELLVFLGERPFFFSDSPNAADLAVYGQMRTFRSGPTPQVERLIDERPALGAYIERVDAATRAGEQTPRLAAAS